MTHIIKRIGSLSRSELEELLIDAITTNEERAKQINDLRKELAFNVKLVDHLVDKITSKKAGAGHE